jgi:hypothetical protein
MFRLILTSRRAFLLITLIAVLSILGCASTQFVPDADTEKWIGKISGMAKGDLELFFKQTQDQSDFYSVSGSFVMNLETTGGYGSGTATGQVKGKVKNGIMKAKISGVAHVEDGSSHIFGEIIGTISKTKAFGTWRMGHIDGSHSGKWTVEKVVE